MRKAYFQYYETFENIVQKFNDVEEREFFRGVIIRYGLYGEEPQGLDEKMDLAFMVVKEMIDDQIHRREVYAANRKAKADEKQAEEKPKTETKRYAKPTVEEIAAYCAERNNGIDAQNFFDFYESKGWKVGNQAMKDWKAAVRTWEQRKTTFGIKPQSALPSDRLTL